MNAESGSMQQHFNFNELDTNQWMKIGFSSVAQFSITLQQTPRPRTRLSVWQRLGDIYWFHWCANRMAKINKLFYLKKKSSQPKPNQVKPSLANAMQKQSKSRTKKKTKQFKPDIFLFVDGNLIKATMFECPNIVVLIRRTITFQWITPDTHSTFNIQHSTVSVNVLFRCLIIQLKHRRLNCIFNLLLPPRCRISFFRSH